MNYKIVVDSCCDLPKEYRKNPHIEFIPLTLIVDDYEIIDDETFDQADFIKRMAESKSCPKSACPSPEVYANACKDENTNIFMVTLSSKLSGSYNSAMLGVDLYIEEGGANNVHVFDSESASAGEAVIVYKILECIDAGMDFDELIKTVTKFRDTFKTYFVLESLDALRKNGRLSNIQAFIASALQIKPIMGSTKGEIIKLEQARGINKALSTMCRIVLENVDDTENKVLSIAHCNCPARASQVKDILTKTTKFKDVIIAETAGVSTLYASDGGIVVVV